MATATSSSAKNLFNDSKNRLAHRIGVNINNTGEKSMVQNWESEFGFLEIEPMEGK